MARPFTFGALSLGRFRPSVHLYPPLLLLTCLVASTAAPAVGGLPHESLGVLEELRQLLIPGFGASPEYLVGSGGIGLGNPVTGLVVPPFQYSVAPFEESVDGFVVPSGVFLARSSAPKGDSLFRLSSPLSFLWSGTASTPAAQLTWPAGTLFDSVFNGAIGKFVPFRVVSAGSSERDESSSETLELAIAAEPADEDPGQEQPGDLFETALLRPATELPPGAPADQLPGDLPDGPGEGPISEGPDPASVPGPLPLAGVAVAFRFSRHLRQRLRQGR